MVIIARIYECRNGTGRSTNFNNFYLGDDAAKLANELVPEIAAAVGVDIGDGQDPKKLGKLVGALGERNEYPGAKIPPPSKLGRHFLMV